MPTVTGDISLKVQIGGRMAAVELHNVLLVPSAGQNLVSVDLLTTKGYRVLFEKGGAVFFKGSESFECVPTRGGNVMPISHDEPVACPTKLEGTATKKLKSMNESSEYLYLLHQRLGHISLEKIKHMVTHDLVTGVDARKISLADKLPFCVPCAQGKMHQKPFEAARPSPYGRGECWTLDLSGPWPTSAGGNKYYINFICDKTRFVVLELLKTRTAAVGVIKALVAYMLTQFGITVKAIRSDNAPELTSKYIETWCRQLGLQHQTSIVYTPQQVGGNERNNRTIGDRVRSMLHGASLEHRFWSYAALHAALLVNVVPGGGVEGGVSPWFAWYGTAPHIADLRIFGCRCMAHVTGKEHQRRKGTKLDAKAHVSIYLGVAADKRGDIVWDLEDNKARASRTLVFDERVEALHAKLWREGGRVASKEPDAEVRHKELDATIQHKYTEASTGGGGSGTGAGDDGGLTGHRAKKPGTTKALHTPRTPHTPPFPGDLSRIIFGTPGTCERSIAHGRIWPPLFNSIPWTEDFPSTEGDTVDEKPAEEEEGTSLDLPQEEQEERVGWDKEEEASVVPEGRPQREKKTTRQPDFEYDSAVVTKNNCIPSMCSVYDDITPLTYKAAINHPQHAEQWRHAIEEELSSLMEMGTWKYSQRPAGRKAITAKWVFKIKEGFDGSIERFKARLCARGFTQTKGVDYFETYAPVAQMTAIRVVFAIAAHLDLDLHQMDVQTAFLNGELEEQLFMEQPAGMEHVGGIKTVCELLRSIYGLKQAGRCWNTKINGFFVDKMGMVRCQMDACIYVCQNGDLITIVVLFVDDIIIASNDPGFVERLKKGLCAEYKMKDLGELEWVLQMKVIRDRVKRTITICQDKKIMDLVEKFGGQNERRVDAPWDPNMQLERHEGINASVPYASLVCSISYLATCTRPDIQGISSELGRHLQAYGAQHWEAAMRALRYLKATAEQGLTFGGQHDVVATRDNAQQSTPTSIREGDILVRSDDLILRAFVDANWAGAEDKRRSRTGFVLMLAGAPIIWSSKLQEITSHSSVQAELIAANAAAREVVYVRNLLTELGQKPHGATIMYEDNTGAISNSSSVQQGKYTRHMDIRHFYVREQVAAQRVLLVHVSTLDQLADPFTKGMSPRTFVPLRRRLLRT